MADELSGIRRAVVAAGSQTKLAAMIGVGQGRVHDWTVKGYVPTSRAPIVASATGISLIDLLRPPKLKKARKRGKEVRSAATQ